MLTDDLAEALQNALDEIKIVNQNTARIATALERIVQALDELVYAQFFDDAPALVVERTEAKTE